MKKRETSWGKAADWYDGLLERGEGSTYQRELILPNLIRLFAVRDGAKVSPRAAEQKTILDLACGQGFFSRAFAEHGARIIGVDISKELIEIAKRHGSPNITYHVALADKISFVGDGGVDAVLIVLALQNIENVKGVFSECARVLKPEGKLVIVLNHPAFRVPKRSSWGWDSEKKIQYRRIDGYLSESIEQIDMHPGANPKEKTVSFHRPLQFYAKTLANAGFSIARIEEWNSHKKSESGPRAKAEDEARKEIPLFLMIEAAKR
jgi:ubiquinone/menaquinone biosynthesis C-methylase UbiE